MLSPSSQMAMSNGLADEAGIATRKHRIAATRTCGARTTYTERNVAARPDEEPIPSARGEDALCTEHGPPRRTESFVARRDQFVDTPKAWTLTGGGAALEQSKSSARSARVAD